jgi:hypothetical protein
MCGAVKVEEISLRFPFETTDFTRNVYEHKQKCGQETQLPNTLMDSDETGDDSGTETRRECNESFPLICLCYNRPCNSAQMLIWRVVRDGKKKTFISLSMD